MICEVCNENEAEYEGHYEEHIPNPREIDVCKGCHGKIHSSWKWILRKRPNTCPLHIPLTKPKKLREKYNVEGEGVASIEDSACWYPNQFYTDMARSGHNKTNDHPCSEIETQLNKAEKEFSYLDCHIFSKWYWKKYFKTLEGLDDE